MKITDYLTVAGSSGKELDEAVREYISRGYQPYGNPYLSDNQVAGVAGDFTMFQAMVLDEENAEEMKHDEAAARQLEILSKSEDVKTWKKLRSQV